MEGKTVLVGIDFQEASLEALSTAEELAAKLGLDLVALHVYTIPAVPYPGLEFIITPNLADEIAVAAKQSMDRLAASHEGMKPLIRVGDPAAEMLRAVEEIKPAMVVVGTHGRRGISRLFLGSVAEKIVRSCPAPVLTVHSKELATDVSRAAA
jgi:nucleotide-binding universal stress UspA family protein